MKAGKGLSGPARASWFRPAPSLSFYCHPICDQTMGEAPPDPPSAPAVAPASPLHSPSPDAGAPAASLPTPPRPVLRTHTLRDRIVEHLRATQADSISGISRFLASGGEAPVHRLTVAGYLQAMAEAGILRELDRPPSKLYQLQNPEAHWSLHQRLHRLLQESPLPEAERCRLAIAALQRALGRPIFQAELQHAGFQQVPPGVDRVVVGDATRRQYRDLFGRRATPRIEVPARDPLLSLPEGDPLHSDPRVEELLRKVLLRATGAEHLVAERPTGPQQVALDLGGSA
jgi:hypothetical protein